MSTGTPQIFPDGVGRKAFAFGTIVAAACVSEQYGYALAAAVLLALFGLVDRWLDRKTPAS